MVRSQGNSGMLSKYRKQKIESLQKQALLVLLILIQSITSSKNKIHPTKNPTRQFSSGIMHFHDLAELYQDACRKYLISESQIGTEAQFLIFFTSKLNMLKQRKLIKFQTIAKKDSNSKEWLFSTNLPLFQAENFLISLVTNQLPHNISMDELDAAFDQLSSFQ